MGDREEVFVCARSTCNLPVFQIHVHVCGLSI